jgi:hypothetical protein
MGVRLERFRRKAASDGIVNAIIYRDPIGKAAMFDTEIWRNDPDEWERARMAAGERIAATASSR